MKMAKDVVFIARIFLKVQANRKKGIFRGSIKPDIQTSVQKKKKTKLRTVLEELDNKGIYKWGEGIITFL